MLSASGMFICISSVSFKPQRNISGNSSPSLEHISIWPSTVFEVSFIKAVIGLLCVVPNSVTVITS